MLDLPAQFIDFPKNPLVAIVDAKLAKNRGEYYRGNIFSNQKVKRVRWFKVYVYHSIPSQLRVVLYFLYRYFILLGFLDGKLGFYWHFFQAFWYRMVVEYKLLEHESTESQGLQ